MRSADGALNGIFAGGRAAFRANRLITVRAAIGAIGQLRAAPWTSAGEIESAVGTNFHIGADFGVALGAGEDHDRKFGTAIDTNPFVF